MCNASVPIRCRYQRTVNSTCAGFGGAPIQAILHVYVPFGKGSYAALQYHEPAAPSHP